MRVRKLLLVSRHPLRGIKIVGFIPLFVLGVGILQLVCRISPSLWGSVGRFTPLTKVGLVLCFFLSFSSLGFDWWED